MTTNIFNFPLAEDYAAKKNAREDKARLFAKRIIDGIHSTDLVDFPLNMGVTTYEMSLFNIFKMKSDILKAGYKTIGEAFYFSGEPLMLQFYPNVDGIDDGQYSLTTGLFTNLITSAHLPDFRRQLQSTIAHQINCALGNAVRASDPVRVDLSPIECTLFRNDGKNEIERILGECGFTAVVGSDADGECLIVRLKGQ